MSWKVGLTRTEELAAAQRLVRLDQGGLAAGEEHGCQSAFLPVDVSGASTGAYATLTVALGLFRRTAADACASARTTLAGVTDDPGFSTRAIHAGQEPDSGDRGGRPADLRHLDLRPGRGGRRPRRVRVLPLGQPDADRAGGVHGGAGGRQARLRLRQRPGRRGHAAAHHRQPGQPLRGAARRVRRHVPAVRQGARALGGARPIRRRWPTWPRSRPRSRPGETTGVWIETPTNPLLAIADIAAIAELAHAAGALVIVDNTFASPYLQQPLALGADVVVHSTTKYCGGHSDVIGGALVVNDDDLAERLRFHQNAIGGVASPFDSWLVLRGLRTLSVRMDRHCDNAEQVAAFLAEHPKVNEVYFPGLPSHPGHDLAKRQMRRFGGMVSFTVAGGEQAALEVCGRTKVITLGESLGGVESLIEHPGRMTHASVAGTQLEVPARPDPAQRRHRGRPRPDRRPRPRACASRPVGSAAAERSALEWAGAGRRQSIGSPPWRTSSSLARLNGREPKKPERADSGDGWALAMYGTEPSIGTSDCASRPHRIATSGPPRATRASMARWRDLLPAPAAVRARTGRAARSAPG